MTVPYTVNEGDKSLLSSVQLWMSRLQLVTAVVSERSLTDRECTDGSLLPTLTSLSITHIQSAFFASTDGLLLGRVGTYVPEDTSVGNILTYTTLSGALALHTSAGASTCLSLTQRLTRLQPSYNRISRLFRTRKVQQDLRPNL